jgi:hypothetical protein
MKFPALLFTTFLLVPSSATLADDTTPRTVFEQLKTLTGDWKSTKPSSNTVVNYRVIANGTTLVESWTMSPTRQSMTVYTLDGERLIATHYCPQGNAPRLQFTQTDESGNHRFAFFDGANLQDPSGSHEHAFRLRIDATGTLTRNEVYIRNGATYDPKTDVAEDESFVRR